MLKFLCDSMLGSLAKRLRMIGFDTAYGRLLNSNMLLEKAREECRTVLTRRTELHVHNLPVPHYFLSANDVQSQFDDVMRHFKIIPDTSLLLSRCLACNKQLVKIEKNRALGRVPEYIYNTIDAFSLCPECGKIFWKGTHYLNMLKSYKLLLSVILFISLYCF